ncbi:hypothetical protein CEXT_215271 [Caerostris extrusa]|uniref:Uncharacterized protein n=1 Tax=Caerostris extrusa TaxID=172846 RepID=A0AAV4XV29_CAEEX|nr:hypothetical protein CEXT_215271 [Caerostris extrusa]
MEYLLDHLRIRQIEVIIDCILICEELVAAFHNVSIFDCEHLTAFVGGDTEKYDSQECSMSEYRQNALRDLDYGETLIDSFRTVPPTLVDDLQEILIHGRARLLSCDEACTSSFALIKYKLRSPQ